MAAGISSFPMIASTLPTPAPPHETTTLTPNPRQSQLAPAADGRPLPGLTGAAGFDTEGDLE